MASENVLPHEGMPLGIAEIKLMVRPMTDDDDLHWSNTAVAVKGSDAQARACRLLQGRGLPGDTGYNKTSYYFKLEDERKVSVSRSTNKHGTWVVIRVSKTKPEIHAERRSRDDAYRLEAAHRQKEKALAMAEAEERMASPEVFRTRMEWAISDLESYIVEGNRRCLVDRNMPSTYRLDCDDKTLHLVEKLKAIVCNCRIKPVRSLRLVAT